MTQQSSNTVQDVGIPAGSWDVSPSTALGVGSHDRLASGTQKRDRLHSPCSSQAAGVSEHREQDPKELQ